MARKPTNKTQAQGSACRIPIGKIIVLTVLVGIVSYYVHQLLTSPPDLPEVDLREWWGPFPIDQNQDGSIRPFKIEFSDVVVNDLRERLLHQRPLVPPLENTGFTYGFNSDFLTRVLDYWKNSYKFKDRETYLNQYSHYITNIQGLDIHFMHVKPKVMHDVTIQQVIPLVLLHGWPGSVREFYEMIPKLATPRDDVAFVFEIIAPSLPGFGFSQGAARPGFGPIQAAGIIHTLMQRLGHSKYYVHGGDAGHAVGSLLATLFPNHVLGFHTNFPTMLFSTWANVYTFLGSYWPSLIVEPEVASRLLRPGRYISLLLEEAGYMHIQATKPDTIGTALTDSPAGLAAYILEKFSTWTNPDFKKARDGKIMDRFQLTHLLDNVMIYWVSNSITTSMRMYAETFSRQMLDMRIDDIPTKVPTWGIKFKHELVFYPDCVLRLKYTNYLHTTVVDDGGHFAAFEMPDLMAEDIFKAVQTFREFHEEAKGTVPAKSVYEFTVKDLNGKEVKLEEYKGYVLLIVNVASECGLTGTNYKQLNELYEKYESKGLRILAFPCNQFGGQEPGTAGDIFKFTRNRGVKFDLFEKVEVNGDNAHPLWKYLKSSQKGTMGDFIKWNFSKFLVNRIGLPVARFGPNFNPLEIEPYLAKQL